MKKKVLSIIMTAAMVVAMTVGCEGKKANDNGQESSGSDESKSVVEIKNEGEPLRIGAVESDEPRILGTIVADYLELQGYEVDRSATGTIGNAELVRQSILQDQVDLTIEYTGRGLLFIDDVDPSLFSKDYETAFLTSKEGDAKNGINWLTYAPFNNTDSLVVRSDWAEENGIESIRDLADYFNNGGEGKVSVLYDYILSLPTGFLGWKDVYGLDLSEDQELIGIANPEAALRDGTDGIVASHLYSTDALIQEYDLKILDDPEHVAPIYSGAIIASDKIIEKYPELETIFNDLFAVIDDEEIMELNRQYLSDGLSEDEISENFLSKYGFVD